MRKWNTQQIMGRAVATLLLSSCAAVTGLAASESYTPPSFDRYQPILNRMPFGALPPDFNATPVDAEAAKTEEQVKGEQQKLAKQVNMSAVNVTPDGGTAIGFTDLSEKPPINYYLLVGAEGGGWKVISADYDEEQATIEKDGISITLKLGKGLVDTPPAAKPGAASAAVKGLPPAGMNRDRPMLGLGHAVRPSLSMIPRMSNPPGLTHAGPAENRIVSSYKDRLIERQQQDRAKKETDEQNKNEQLVKLAREAAQKEIARREAEAAVQTTTDAQEALPADAPQEAPQ